MKWLLALAFVDSLDWSFFYDRFGLFGLMIAYVLIAWGEPCLYGYVAYRLWRNKVKKEPY